MHPLTFGATLGTWALAVSQAFGVEPIPPLTLAGAIAQSYVHHDYVSLPPGLASVTAIPLQDGLVVSAKLGPLSANPLAENGVPMGTRWTSFWFGGYVVPAVDIGMFLDATLVLRWTFSGGTVRNVWTEVGLFSPGTKEHLIGSTFEEISIQSGATVTRHISARFVRVPGIGYSWNMGVSFGWEGADPSDTLTLEVLPDGGSVRLMLDESAGACCCRGGCLALTPDDCAARNGSFVAARTACRVPGIPAACCTSDFDGDGEPASMVDLYTFLQSWFERGAIADLNHNGSVSVQDLLDFIHAWFRPCYCFGDYTGPCAE